MDKHYLTKTEKFWDIAELYLLLILFLRSHRLLLIYFPIHQMYE